MRVTLALRRGPMAGTQRDIDLAALPSGKLILGRDPGPGGWILDGDTTVSRLHGELTCEAGDLIYTNLSANGSGVDSGLLMGRQALKPGSFVKIGAHEIEVRFEPPPSSRRTVEVEAGSLWRHGPLGKPLVRAVLAVYLVALLAVAVLLALRGGGSTDRAFEEARQAYVERYLKAAHLPESETARRLERADALVAELEAHVRGERWSLAEDICRELMALDDGDTRSPLFLFAAGRLGKLADER